MKIVVAGTGSIGRRHISNLCALEPDNAYIIVRSDNRSDELSRSINAKVVASLEEALTYDPDALLVATPSNAHTELVICAISAGLPLYIEKPVVTQHRDLDAVRTALSQYEYHAPSMVGCNLRFLPSLQLMHKQVQNYEIGRIVRASFEAGQWLPDWRPDQNHRKSYSADGQSGGGVIMDLIHEIDSALWLLGEMDVLAARAINVPELEISSEAVACAILGYGDESALVSLSLDYVAKMPIRRYQLIGDKGVLIWDLPTKRLCLATHAGQTMLDCGNHGFDVAETYRCAISEFIDAVKSGKPTSQPIEEGLKSSELAIAIKERACLL